ncbi:hypothetical protein E1B28_009098 [Marasmius oreades]|uniref:Uncharacterized protein n=1 Tax=Marasmius oreades TaxID=181124 RepID=A0A9P7RZX8_9AGAR|nr:uncharacterized protein E1B28_009098 [Marasmius oreades]KAG7092775.1 hypothetical protein E1B28_009098 [Marasmius oreades]
MPPTFKVVSWTPQGRDLGVDLAYHGVVAGQLYLPVQANCEITVNVWQKARRLWSTDTQDMQQCQAENPIGGISGSTPDEG